jgi:hypothetical protein
VCRSSDLAASGAGNGCVRLWAIESETKGIRTLFNLPLVSQSNIVIIVNFLQLELHNNVNMAINYDRCFPFISMIG